MPYPKEHAARIREPEEFIAESFRSKDVKTGIRMIVGVLKDGDSGMVTQSYRFAADLLTVIEAKKWLKDHDIEYIAFEPASGEDKSMTNEIERRFYRSEIRAVLAQNGERRIIGYAAVFNQESEDLGGWREIIKPGAFTEALSHDVRALFNHDANLILGRTISNTLELSEDDIGLHYEITPPDTQYAHDLIVSLERGDVDQSSFGFRVLDEAWQSPSPERSYPVRQIKRVELFDVSPVTFPAYPTTSVAVRDMASKLAADSRATGAATETQPTQRTAGRLALLRRKLKHFELLGG